MNKLKLFVPVLSLLAAACATDSNVPNTKVAPGERPKLATTEAGLWMTMDKLEKKLATSSRVNRDRELNAYLNAQVCKLVPEHCGDIRLFVLKHPYFNASMAPNGSMHVWTGLLLRAENENQLAAVLGHELAHYLHRHSLKRFNTVKATADFLAFFSIATGGLGVGFVGLVANIGAAGALQGYSRDLEREADFEGVQLMYAAGYDPNAAHKLWERVKAEKDAKKDKNTTSVFWSTHPPTEERIKSLKEQAAKLEYTSPAEGGEKSNEFDRIVKRYWHKWMRDMLSTRAYEQALVVLNRLQARGFDSHEVEFFKGEVYRRRSGDEDMEKAKEHYLKAAEQQPAPLTTYKQLGLVEKRQGNKDKAIEYFSLYLNQNLESTDRSLVESYIAQLRK